MTPLDQAHLRRSGASPRAIAAHYEIPDRFFAPWLGDDLVYSCAWWDPADPGDDLARAQRRKIDTFLRHLDVHGGHLLDVGCGWGALAARAVDGHGAASAVGLTLSPSQAAHGTRRGVRGTELRFESWVDHQPDHPYDAITCIEATEHFASDQLTEDGKVAVYEAFFERCAAWLAPGGRLGLQLICLDDAGHERTRPQASPMSELIRTEIFPESMSASLSELAIAWEPHFSLDLFLDHTDHYRRTFRAWAMAARSARQAMIDAAGPERTRTFFRYFATGEACFRLREQALYRVVLHKRPAPKPWVVAPRPSRFERPAPADTMAGRGASTEAVTAHYDVSNEFYRLWLGPSMVYTSGWWDDGDDRDSAALRKIDRFTDAVLPDGSAPARVLDVGCGWGAALRRMCGQRPGLQAVGLTLSPAQAGAHRPEGCPDLAVVLESWAEHRPTEPYDAIVSFGAFEHFARDGSTSDERISAYRHFFARCWALLIPGGRIGLETIAHDDAPDTASPKGRGPLGDHVLDLYPESLAPHPCEVVAGFEPYFQVELLRSDGADFARTARAWLLALRARRGEAVDLVGEETVRRYERYLVSTEVQFRMGTITNLRLVLRRRDAVRW